jgi:hypothetical protein
MNKSLIALAFLLASTGLAFACSCAPLPPNLNTRRAVAAWQLRGEQVVFEGRVEHIELKGWPLQPEPGVTINVHPAYLVTFSNSRLYRGAQRKEFIVQTGLGGGDCGYRFKLGELYLVTAGTDDSGGLETGICSGTQPLENAGAALRLLRGEPPSPEDVRDRASEVIDRGNTEPIDYAKVCGKVSFPAGVRPRPVTVRITPKEDELPLLGDTTDTEPDGAFCFEGVDIGKYFIAAIETDPVSTHSRFAGYYPGVPGRSQAAPVEVQTERGVVRADFTVVRQPVYSVRGYLRGVPQSLAESLQFMLMADQLDEFHALEPVALGPHGVFELSGVPPGHYMAFAFRQNDEDGRMTCLSSVVEMEIHANVDDLKLEYVPRK